MSTHYLFLNLLNFFKDAMYISWPCIPMLNFIFLQGSLHLKIAHCYLSLEERSKSIMFFYKGNLLMLRCLVELILLLYICYKGYYFRRQFLLLRHASSPCSSSVFQSTVIILQYSLFVYYYQFCGVHAYTLNKLYSQNVKIPKRQR